MPFTVLKLSSCLGEKPYSKSSTIRDPNWQIGKYGKESVDEGRLESQVMRDLVNGQEQVLIRRRPDHVRSDQKGP